MKLLFFALFCCAAFAQTAALTGLVTDESGAILQKATVRLTGPGGFDRLRASLLDAAA